MKLTLKMTSQTCFVFIKHQTLRVINTLEKAYGGARIRLAIIQLVCTISFFI